MFESVSVNSKHLLKQKPVFDLLLEESGGWGWWGGQDVKENIHLLTLTATLNPVESTVYLTLAPTFNLCRTVINSTSERLHERLLTFTAQERNLQEKAKIKTRHRLQRSRNYPSIIHFLPPTCCLIVTATSPGSLQIVEVTVPTDNERAAAAGDECATWRYFDT